MNRELYNLVHDSNNATGAIKRAAEYISSGVATPDEIKFLSDRIGTTVKELEDGFDVYYTYLKAIREVGIEEGITFLKTIHPTAEIFQSGSDKDFIIIRETLCISDFGKNDKGEKVTVPNYKQTQLHIDTVKLMIITSKRINPKK